MQIAVELDTSRPRRDGTCRVRITLYRKKLSRFPLDLTVKPEDWDHKRCRVKFGVPNHHLKNALIDKALQRAERIALEEPGITPDMLRDRMGGTDTTGEEFHEALVRHVNEHAHRLSFGTRKGRLTVARDVATVLPLVTLAGLSVAHVMDMDRWYAGRVQSNTRRSRLRRLRTMYRSLCKGAGIPAKDLFDGIIPAEVDKGARFVPPDELERFAAATVPDRWRLARDAWMLAYHLGGMRVGDLCRLRPYMIEGDAIAWVAGKVPKPRWVPINTEARAIIEAYQGGEMVLPLIDPNLQGDAQDKAIESATASLNRWLRLTTEHLKIRPITMHMARHTWAELAQVATEDIRAVSKILGHARTATTERYLSRFDRSAVQGVFDKIKTKV